MTYLLDSYVVIGPRLPLEHHRRFVWLLLASPGTAALSSLASHLSLVSSLSSDSTQDAPAGFDGPAISTDESQQPEVFIRQRKTTVFVQSALTNFVANILSARISAEAVQVASVLPDGSEVARAELSRQAEVMLCHSDAHSSLPNHPTSVDPAPCLALLCNSNHHQPSYVRSTPDCINQHHSCPCPAVSVHLCCPHSATSKHPQLLSISQVHHVTLHEARNCR